MKSSTINLIGAGIALVIIGSAGAWGVNKVQHVLGATVPVAAAEQPTEKPTKVPHFTYIDFSPEGLAVATIETYHRLFDSNLLDDKIKRFDDPKSDAWTAILREPAFDDASYSKLANTLGAVEGLGIDLHTLSELADIAKQKHDTQALVYMHRILHDLDYWAFPNEDDQGKSSSFFGVTETVPAHDSGHRIEMGDYISKHKS
ncbi:hypothetical protein [Paenibacillus silvisoli]|uniref:hypothetical protein n=1 Tax=Paenibacillus silvisoli TaxID=3110539 RepID=UPI002805A244|nr:hypothetical protein [Paenibacillus silvisoli]